MDIAYSKKQQRYISAEDLNKQSCLDNMMLCPACHKPVFKVRRANNIHYLAHYKSKNITHANYEQCELRVFNLYEKIRKKAKKNTSKRGINKVILIGNISEIETHKVKGKGGSITLNVFTNTDKENHQVKVSKKLKKNISAEIKINSEILVEGRIKTRYWHDENGNYHERSEVIASNVLVFKN